MDKDRHRVSLGMKSSYFSETIDIQKPPKQSSDDAITENSYTVGNWNLDNLNVECENGEHQILAEVEARASVLPLEVPLDDIEAIDTDKQVNQNIESVDNPEALDEKNKRRAKKKAREER